MTTTEPSHTKIDKEAIEVTDFKNGSPSQNCPPEDSPGEVNTDCGLGSCRLPCLQRFAHPLAFTLSLAFCAFTSTLLGPLFVSQVTSVERQFELTSTQSGGLMAANDVGFLLLVLVVAHFGKHSHRPRILAIGTIVYGLAGFGIAATNFLQPQSLKDLSNKNQSSLEQDHYLCLDTSDPRWGTVSQTNRECDAGNGGAGKGGSGEKGLYVILLMGVLFGLQGVAKATRAPLGMSFIDDNVPNRAKTGLYVGIMLTIMLFGPPLGFALGGVINSIPVDLSDTAITSSDPRWISAWWLGFLPPAFLSLLFALPLLCFPRKLPNSRQLEDSGTSRDSKNSQDSKDSKDCQDSKKSQDFKDSQDSKNSQNSKQSPTPQDFKESKNSQDSKDLDLHSEEKVDDVYKDGKRESPQENDQPGLKDTQKESADKIRPVTGEKENTTPDQNLQNNNFSSALKELPSSLCRLLSNPVFVLMMLTLSIKLFAIVGFGSFFIKFIHHQYDLEPRLGSYIFGLSSLIFNGIGTFSGGVLTTRVLKTRRQILQYIVVAHGISILLLCVTLFLGCDGRDMVGLDENDVLTDDAIEKCHCDVSQYLPVCGGNKTFLSPCHAGCSRTINATHFSGCKFSDLDTVRVGVCSPGCDYMIAFIIVQLVSSALKASNITPIYVIVIRSVSQQDKSLALGLKAFAMSLLGFIPGPIAFGAIVDTTCRVWSSTCGRPGACSLYDVTQLRFRYIGLEIGGNVVSYICSCLALGVLLWQVKTGRTEDDKLEADDIEISLKDEGERGGQGAQSKDIEMTQF